MTALDDLPVVGSFLGLDLKTGCFIIAAIGIVHPMAYGCSLFTPISYLIITIWILVALFMAASIALIYGINHDDHVICAVWIWYALIFVALMMMMMTLLAVVFTSRKQKKRVLVIVVGMLWYIATIYFILVVNSYRKQLVKEEEIREKLIEKNMHDDDKRDYVILEPILPKNTSSANIDENFSLRLMHAN